MSNSLDPNQTRRFVGLTWMETVCHGYHQTTLVDRELTANSIWKSCLKYTMIPRKLQLQFSGHHSYEYDVHAMLILLSKTKALWTSFSDSCRFNCHVNSKTISSPSVSYLTTLFLRPPGDFRNHPLANN